MRDVAQKALLSIDQAGEALRHQVDGVTQASELVPAPQVELDFKLPVCDLTGCGSKSGDGVSQTANQRQPANNGDHKNSEYDGKPGAVIEEEGLRPNRWNFPDQRRVERFVAALLNPHGDSNADPVTDRIAGSQQGQGRIRHGSMT